MLRILPSAFFSLPFFSPDGDIDGLLYVQAVPRLSMHKKNTNKKKRTKTKHGGCDEEETSISS